MVWGSIVDFCCCLVTKSRLTLCDHTDYSLPDSSVHEISEARILEWVALSFSRESSQPRDQTRISWLAGGFFTTEPSVTYNVLVSGAQHCFSHAYICIYFSSLFCYHFTSVQSLSCVRLLATPWTAACQASLSITNSQSLLKLMSIELVMPSFPL